MDYGLDSHRLPIARLLVSSIRLKCRIISSKCLINEHYRLRVSILCRGSQEPKWCIVLSPISPPPQPGHRVPHVEGHTGNAEDGKEMVGQPDCSQVSLIPPLIPCGRWSNPMPKICSGCLCPSRSPSFDNVGIRN